MTVEALLVSVLHQPVWRCISAREVKSIEYDAAGNCIRYSGKNCEDMLNIGREQVLQVRHEVDHT